MSSPADIRDELAEVLHDVADIAHADVRDTAALKDLGIDSLGRVELTDGLERRFSINAPEVDVAEWRTVGDIVRTVTRQQELREQEGHNGLIPTPLTITDPEQNIAYKQIAFMFAALGAVVGVGMGVLAAMMLASTGLGAGPMPHREPIKLPIPVTASEEPRPVPRHTAPPEAHLVASPVRVAPGERFTLSGHLATAVPGEVLQIQFRGDGGTWEDFPVTVTAAEGGRFRTELYTGRPGPQQFQVTSAAGGHTPSVTVTIGGPEPLR